MKKLLSIFSISIILVLTSCSLFNKGVRDVIVVRDTVVRYEWRVDTIIVRDTITSTKDRIVVKLVPKYDTITATNAYDLNNYYLQSGELSLESGTIIHSHQENVSEGLKTSEITIHQKEKVKEKTKSPSDNLKYIGILLGLIFFIVIGTYCIAKERS